MEEIKVGDYVRLARNQGINKIEEIDGGVYYLDTPIADEWGYESYAIAKYQLREEVIAHSPNIIDVIEVGDYVNGYKVSFKDNDYRPFVQCDYPVEAGTINHYRFYEEAIKSIVK